MPLFQEKLESYKDEFRKHQLILSEEGYVELKAKPDQHQSLKEFVQVKVFEELHGYMQDLSTANAENKEIFHQLSQLKNKCEKYEIENSGLRQQLKDVRDDGERKLSSLQRRNLDLENEVSTINAQYKVIADKSGKLNQQDQLVRQLEIDLQAFKGKCQDLDLQLTRQREDKHEVERRNESLRREIDNLNQDKAFLSRETQTLEDKAKRLEEKLDRTELALLDAKKQAEKYMERVLNANDDVKSKFDLQYTKEIEELKNRQAKELQSAK